MHSISDLKSKGVQLLDSYIKHLEYNIHEKAANYGAQISMNFLLLGISMLLLIFFYIAVAFGVGSAFESYAVGFLAAMGLIALQLFIVYWFRFSIIKRIKRTLIGINFDETKDQGIIESAEEFYKKKHTLQLSITKLQHDLEKDVQESFKVNNILSNFFDSKYQSNVASKVSVSSILEDGITVIGKTQSIIKTLRSTFKSE